MRCRTLHVEYVRVEPPGIPTALWRSVGPSHNVFVTESFIDELAAAAKQDRSPIGGALLDKAPRAQSRPRARRGHGRLGQQLPERVGRGVSLQFVFATYMAQVAEVEVSKDGAVRVRRVVCAVDCGTVVNPDTVRAQIQSAIIFGITAALHGEITLKDGRVQQSNFHDYQMLRINEAPAIEVYIVTAASRRRDGRSRNVGDRPRGDQRDLCGDRQAPAKTAGRHRGVEAGLSGARTCPKRSMKVDADSLELRRSPLLPANSVWRVMRKHSRAGRPRRLYQRSSGDEHFIRLAEADRRRRAERRIRRGGPANGPPVILLHGWPYDIYSYVDVARCWRRRATGCSSLSARLWHDALSFERNVPQRPAVGGRVDIIAFMDALKIEKATLAGCDWGARRATSSRRSGRSAARPWCPSAAI
jgi:hypothetical protein